MHDNISNKHNPESESRLIFSRNHPQIKRIRSLQTREGREQTGLFLIEGVRPLAEALQQNIRIETLIVAPELLTNLAGKRCVKQARIAGTPCLRLSPEVYHHLSQAEEPQGVAAIVKQRWQPLDQIRPGSGLCWLALEKIRSGGNLGTIIRTSDAVGGAGILLLGDCADPYDPTTVRASMGAVFAQQFVRATVSEFLAWKARRHIPVVGTALNALCDYHSVSYPRPSLLLMGCEKRGLSPELQTACDLLVKIPMVGRSDSLNLGVATGVMLYELFHQRRADRASERPPE